MAFRNSGNKIAVNETISNVSINLIEITEDKLVNILNNHIAGIKKSKDWIGAVALSVSLIGIFLTSSFHDTWFISKETLQAFFCLILLISLGYTFYTIHNCVKYKITVEDIIIDIKGEKK